MSSKKLNLGTTQDGYSVEIDPKTRATHMHIIGSTGEGKSKFMEHMIRWDILHNNGLTLIDPHGHLTQDIIRWAETNNLMSESRPKKILVFDPHEADWTFGFNPLKIGSAEIAYHVDAMVQACAQVWGGEDTDKTPLLKRCLRAVFHVLAEKNLSLLEALYLISPTDKIVRQYLTQDIADAVIKEQWDTFNSMGLRDFYNEFGSTLNRLMEFLASPIVRSIIGQLINTIDFRQIMDQDYVLLVNLATGDKLSEDNASLLGTLIVNDLFMRAKGRSKETAIAHPHYLYVDECALFINQDIGRVLDEGRKFGLHLILAHQHLAQLKTAGEAVYHAIMTDAKTKVIFGGLNVDDAEVMAKQVFLSEIDLQEYKDKVTQPMIMKYVKTILANYSQGRGLTTSQSVTVSEGQALTEAETESETVKIAEGLLGEEPVGDLTRTAAQSQARTQSWSRAASTVRAQSQDQRWGGAETYQPLLKERPTTVYTWEEQIKRKMALMVNQPQRNAIIKLPKKHSEMVETPPVKEGFANDQRVKRFKERCYNLADFAQPVKEIEQKLKARQAELKQKAREQIQGPAEPDDFWE
ncbi:MAG: type IV secretion system DNA-binding domain-containing protein [Deltaproteobacteria bacterium]|nr:type IV secretion system DNA-binding domain-containing protein [Deltaproteobacteria bacterium]